MRKEGREGGSCTHLVRESDNPVVGIVGNGVGGLRGPSPESEGVVINLQLAPGVVDDSDGGSEVGRHFGKVG